MSRVLSRAAADARRVAKLRCVAPGVASESVLRQSPKMALGSAFMELKRAAEAKKCQRIAGRLAALAGARRAGTAAGMAPGVAYVRDVDGPQPCWRAVRLN